MARLSIVYDKDIQQRVFRLLYEAEPIQKIDTTLDITADPQSIYDDGTITLNGTLLDAESQPLPFKTIRILKNNVLLEEVTTLGNGTYTLTVDSLTVGTHYFRASFMGDEIYDNSSSDTIGVSVVSHNYALTISVNTQSIYPNESVTVSGKLTKDGSDYGSQTVEIYDGNSKVGEATTNSSGNYSTDISGLIVGTHTLKAKFNNTYSSTRQVVVNPLIETEISIDVPLVLVYGDDFNISGYLTTQTRQAIERKTVKLKVGSTVVDYTTTEIDGSYSFTQTPVATGNHSFQVVFDGADEYENSESSIVSRVVGKETTVLTVTSPINNYSTDSSSIQFAGTLTDDDGIVMSGASVKISEGTTGLATLTTDSNGAFGITLNNITIGSHQYTVTYEGDSNYTASTVNRTVTRTGHSYSLEVESDKDILSYADSESTTVTATLRDNQVLVPNQELSYTVKHGATTIDSGSDTTDANGEISFTYTASGIGDVTVEVQFGTSLQETYALEDCHIYITDYNTIKSSWVKDTSVSGRTIYKLLSNYQSDVELTFKLKNNVPSNFLLGFGDTGGSPAYWAKMMYYQYNNVLWIFADNDDTRLGTSISTSTVFKLTTENLHKINAYTDDTLQAYRTTNSSHQLNVRIDDYTASPLNLDYLKIKAL